jgi:hypothetical protein
LREGVRVNNRESIFNSKEELFHTASWSHTSPRWPDRDFLLGTKKSPVLSWVFCNLWLG